jgi:hypothetical protein
MALRASETVFVRYVSQNVGYTATIILKRVVKSKVELGIGLMLILYMPVLYNLMQSILGIYLVYIFGMVT